MFRTVRSMSSTIINFGMLALEKATKYIHNFAEAENTIVMLIGTNPRMGVTSLLALVCAL